MSFRESLPIKLSSIQSLLIILLIATGGLAQQQPTAQPASTASQQSAQNTTVEPGKAQPARPAGTQVLQQLNLALQDLVARVSPAVVQIQVAGYGALEETNPSEAAVIARQNAIGSGVIVDSNGYIMTNAHVVRGAQRIRVVLSQASTDDSGLQQVARQRLVTAKLVGVHEESDLALLKIDQTGLPALSLRPSGRVHQGELVLAVGSPEGLENTVTLGVVSSVARQPDPEKPMVYIQTDAPINPGNSGGPLIDTDGYVLGLNTMIFSQSGGSEGLGFAIPSRIVEFVYQSLRKNGHVHRVEIEAAAQSITPTLAEGLGLPQTYGVIISDITPGGPADTAGLQIGDIVASADGRTIDTLPRLTAVMYLHPLDELLTLVIKRGGTEKTVHVPVLEHRDQMDKLLDAVDPSQSLVQRLGILGIDLNDQLRSIVGDVRIPSGVVVLARAISLLGPETGLKSGDIIHSVNRTPIDSLDALRTCLQPLKPGSAVVLQVERDNKLEWLSFELD
jgi:serine protease Do